ncbi:hypothetical protein P9112_009308 [Eukaryota sp. TZLM1-RC]
MQYSRFALLTEPLTSPTPSQASPTLDDVLERLRDLFPISPPPLTAQKTLDSDSPQSPISPISSHHPSSRSVSPSQTPSPHRNNAQHNTPSSNVESDRIKIKWRQRQIQYGKSTPGYARYLQEVPKHLRQPHHPKTPPLDLKISKKKWGYMCSMWRRALHTYDSADDG